MNDAHPTYPNPTIQEAVCELRFKLSDGVKWEPTIFSSVFSKVQSDFPSFEPTAQVGFRFKVEQEKIDQEVIPSRQRMRYIDKSGKLLFHLSQDMFTINVLPKYQGWENMNMAILNIMGKLTSVIEMECFNRIGLRYINRIERINKDEIPTEWLSQSDYIPKSVLNSLTGFFHRLEVRKDSTNRFIVTLAETKNPSREHFNDIIFDIDCIIEKNIKAQKDSVLKEINSLHDLAWDIFSSSITDKLKRRLRGEI
ncbi:MAG: TIGR04255 family protein [bacterium]